MVRKTFLALALSTCFSGSLLAFDTETFNRALEDYADGISKTAYAVSGDLGDTSEDAYEIASKQAEEAEKRLNKIISDFNNPDEFIEAEQILNKFSTKSDLNSHSAALIAKMLKTRANFVAGLEGAELPVPETNDEEEQNSYKTAAAPSGLLKDRQKRLIMIETPIAEAVIELEDTDKNRRVENLEKIFKRHNCKVISSFCNKQKKNDKYCYYFSGKKYVIDTLLGHFEGNVVNSDLVAHVNLTTGGFWSGKKKQMFTVGPTRSDKHIMGELSWYKSVIEHDPISYLIEKQYNQILPLASEETVAGKKKLLFKNAKAEIWVSANGKSENEAVYHSEVELGDVYVDAK